MAKHTITGWITFKPGYREGIAPTVDFCRWEVKTGDDMKVWGVPVREHSFEVDVPDNFDPRAPMIAGLEQEREAVRAELGAKIAALTEQISRLQALEYTPVAPVVTSEADIPF